MIYSLNFEQKKLKISMLSIFRMTIFRPPIFGPHVLGCLYTIYRPMKQNVTSVKMTPKEHLIIDLGPSVAHRGYITHTNPNGECLKLGILDYDLTLRSD